MTGHSFHEIYLHFNWHTKGDRAILTPDLEPKVHQFVRDRCKTIRGVYFHEVGGTPTHIHLAINIAPFVCISDFIGQLKGACSYEVNQTAKKQLLQWQRGFGVVSFGKQQLPWVRNYIRQQKEHHAKRNVFDRLERIAFDDDGEPIEER